MCAATLGRRAFLRALAAMLCLLGVRGRVPLAATSPHRSKVIAVHDPQASKAGKGFDNADLDAQAVVGMVNRGVVAFTGAADLEKAWRQIIPDPGRRVAIKVNCQIQGVYTKAKVVQPIVNGLLLAGVPADNILIYDMTDTAFALAGFRRNTGPGVKVGTVADFGGYSRFLFHRLANLLTGGYRYSGLNLVSRIPGSPGGSCDCDYLINVPVLKALDGYCGVTLSMKNHYGSIANPGEHHDDIMAHIPLINSLPQIRNKTRLIVLYAIFGQYKWTNGRNQQYVSRVNKVLVSDDPVALDTVGWGMIEALRKEHGAGPVSPAPVYIKRAAALGLGVSDPAFIEQKEITL